MNLAGPKMNRHNYSTPILVLALTLLVAGTIAVSLYAHKKAGFNFPQPWPDESQLLWQAISFQEGNTLLAPQLGEDRPVLWMPPGYFVALGTVFKVTGFSLAKARWFSWMCWLASYLALIVFFADRRPRLLYWGLISIVLLDSYFVVMGNMARMEALVMALALWGFVLLKRNKDWYGLGLLAAAVIVHPNGCYFLLAGGLWFLGRHRLSWPKPSPGSVALLAVLLIGSLVFLACVAMNWQGFVHDMHLQFREKLGNDIKASFLMPKYLFVSASFLALFLFSMFFKPDMLLQLLMGYASVVVRLVGNEQWYVVFVPLSLLILVLSGLDTLALLMEKLRSNMKVLRTAVMCLGAVPCVWLGMRIGMIEPVSSYPARMEWAGFLMSPPEPYILPADVEKVTSLILEKLVPAKTNTVLFSPGADALFFWSASKGRFTISEPLFRKPAPDIVVVRSHFFCKGPWGNGNAKAFNKWGILPEDMVYSRDESSKWFIKQVTHPEAKPGNAEAR
jgi:hypothetical protein